MNINIGSIDRLVRAIIGFALIAFAIFAPQISYSWLGWIGAIPLLTAIFGWCPFYSIFGIDTCERSGKV